MHLLIWLATLLFTALAVIVAVAAGRRRVRPEAEFVAAGSLLTDAELLFKQHLESVIPGTAQVMVKVRLADLVRIESASRHEFARRFNQIKSKHVDFAVCDRRSCKVIWAIELHDSTHERAERVRRDNLVRQILQEAGVPYLELKAQRRYDERTLRALMSGKSRTPMLRLVTH